MKIPTLKKSILLLLLFFFAHQILYSTEIFSIQAGAFSNKYNAQSLVSDLKNHGITCTIHEVEGLYKVYCGEFSQRSDAHALKREFSSLGYEALVVSMATQSSQDPIKEDNPTKQSLYPEVAPSSKEKTDEKSLEHGEETILSDTPILLDRVVAVVNNEVITWSELYKMMETEATDQVEALSEEEKTKIFKDSEAAFLETLIDMRLQLQEANRLRLAVFPEEITETIENIKKKYSMTHTDFLESIQREGFSFEGYKKRLSEQILISKLINHQIRNKIVVSDDEVNSYIEANKEITDIGETYKLRQIFFKGPEGNLDRKTIEDKASMVIQELKAGEDFSELARVYSEDPSGRLSGDLGFINKALLANEFVEVLAEMKAGDVSRPFWTEKGLHIIKLDEKLSAQNIDKVKEDIRRKLVEEKFLKSYKSWINGLKEKAYIEILL